MNGGLEVGCAKVDITPEFPVRLLPTSDSPRLPLGVNRRLHARIVVMRTNEESGQSVWALFVSIDILILSNTCVQRLRASIMEKWGIPDEAVLLNATHTHSAPYPSLGFYASAVDSELDEEYDRYLRWMEDCILDGIEQAMLDLDPVEIDRGSGNCDFASFRRKFVDGQWLMAPDVHGPTDSEVTIVRFTRANGDVKALLVNYTCHPTTTYEDYISSDYPGTAMDRLEEQLGGQGVSLFLQGCCGDVRPAVIRDGRYIRGSDADVRTFAMQLSDEVMRVIGSPMQRVSSIAFAFRRRIVELPYRSFPSPQELETLRNDTDLLGTWSRKLLANPERLKTVETLELTLIRLADNLAFLAMNGEIVGEYGRFAKRASQGAVVPLGYSNGHTTYIPTAEQLEQGGYEGYTIFYLQGKPSPLDSCIEERIKKGIAELIG